MEKELKEMLEKKVSDHLNTPFTLLNLIDDPENPMQVILKGTIVRYQELVNIEVVASKEGPEIKYWHVTDKEISMVLKSFGAITLGKDIVISDPCYTRDVWCMTQLHNVKPGQWNVCAAIDELDTWGKRLYILRLSHETVSSNENNALIMKHKVDLGVDSGQMSVFDDVYYRRKNGSAEEFEKDQALRDTFSERCFSLTRDYIGLFPGDSDAVGVVCSSGIGDGSYPLSVAEEKGEIVIIEISFM